VRYFIRLSFEGSSFHGWQIQQNAHTVQQEINQSLSILLKTEIETTGCGRTDTGVHAKIFYAHFDHENITEKNSLIHSMNAIISPAIAVHSLFEVEETAHARFSALSRTYQYRIYSKKNPFLRNSSYFFNPVPDINNLNFLSTILKEYTDFSAFSKSNTQTVTNNCVITFAGWKMEEDEIVFTITADRFLRNMVRAIVGTLLEAENEKVFRAVLESKSRGEAGVSVPAHGLYLTDVIYPFTVL
jgi:tRNA pseudouridine38-40 synthase